MPAGWPRISPELLAVLRVRRVSATKKRERRRKEAKVPEQRFPRAAELQYLANLKKLQGATEAEVRRAIFPELNRLTLSPPDYITRVVDGVRFAVGEKLSIAELDALISKVSGQLNLFNRGEVNKQLKSVVGIDLFAAEPWIDEHLVTFRRENVNLIKSLQGTQLDDIENLLLRAQRQGLRVEVIRDQIVERFGVSKKKAMLLARDQTGKINGELTQLRQQSIGVEEYTWRCSLDELVRGNPNGLYPNAKPSHWARHGKRFKWSDPPEGGHPSEAIQCRCRAEPDLSHLIGPL